MTNRKVFGLSALILLGLVLFLLGTQAGVWKERERFEFMKSYAIVEADQFLNAGNIDNALHSLFLAKAYEPREGMTDGQLARAYTAKGMPCIAQGYFESSLSYMERNGLTALPQYSASKDAFIRAQRECAKRLGSG